MECGKVFLKRWFCFFKKRRISIKNLLRYSIVKTKIQEKTIILYIVLKQYFIMSKKEESGEDKERIQLGYRTSVKARSRLEEIVKNLPLELNANLSNIQEAIIMAYLKTNPIPEDAKKTEILITKMRRGELK